MRLVLLGAVVVGCGILPLAKLNVHSGFRLKGKAARLQLQRRTERLQTSSVSLRSKIALLDSEAALGRKMSVFSSNAAARMANLDSSSHPTVATKTDSADSTGKLT